MIEAAVGKARKSGGSEPATLARARAGGRDAAATKLRILAAAEAEFAQKGLAGARVDVIADESRVNKRMLYYYFTSKEDLYLAVLERAYAEMRRAERALELAHLEPLAAVRALVEFKFDYFAENPVMIQLLNGENMLGAQHLKRSGRLRDMHLSLVKTIEAILAAGVGARVIRSGIDPLHLYISISGLSYFYFSNTPTLSTAFGRNLATPADRQARRTHAVDVILAFVKA